MGQTVCFRCRQALEESDTLRSLTRACDNCFATVLSTQDERLTGYLESLDHPAALIAPDLSILFANRRFLQTVSGHESAGLRVGEALDCTYAQTLGQCGETVPCILCHLKQAVDQTWQRGQGLRGVPMSYPHKTLARKAYTITTEKIGEGVLLLLGPV
jgi:hypothetical protein